MNDPLVSYYLLDFQDVVINTWFNAGMGGMFFYFDGLINSKWSSRSTANYSSFSATFS